MSSSRDAGYYADLADKTHSSKCPKSKIGEHTWIDKAGSWPSIMRQCTKCKATYYTK